MMAEGSRGAWLLLLGLQNGGFSPALRDAEPATGSRAVFKTPAGDLSLAKPSAVVYRCVKMNPRLSSRRKAVKSPWGGGVGLA